MSARKDSHPYHFLDLTSFARALQPHLGVVLGILGRSMSFLPSFILPEHIHFEDGLGRVKTLPYQYFRHWQVWFALFASNRLDQCLTGVDVRDNASL